MTPFAYANTAATTTRLLERFGAAATIKRTTTGEYDPETGETPVIVTELPTTAAVFAYDQKYIDDTLIKQGDQRAYLTPANEPKQGDTLVWQGRGLSIVAVRPVSPGGVPVMYEAQLRG